MTMLKPIFLSEAEWEACEVKPLTELRLLKVEQVTVYGQIEDHEIHWSFYPPADPEVDYCKFIGSQCIEASYSNRRISMRFHLSREHGKFTDRAMTVHLPCFLNQLVQPTSHNSDKPVIPVKLENIPISNVSPGDHIAGVFLSESGIHFFATLEVLRVETQQVIGRRMDSEKEESYRLSPDFTTQKITPLDL